METILSLDIGTTGAKAALVDRGGSLLATGYAAYPTHTASSGMVEQRPGDWWDAVRLAVNDLWQEGPSAGPESMAGVALSGQMQDLILLGPSQSSDECALGSAILYSDSRAEEEAAWLVEQVGAEKLMRITGNSQGAGSLLAKWRWLQNHDGERLSRARKILVGAHNYIAWQLTDAGDSGATVADPTTASTTGLLDLARNEWATPLLNRLGFDVNLLPELLPAGEICGHVSDAAAEQTLLPAGTPVYTGAGDLGATTVGVGAGEPGRLYGYLGTSGWIAATLEEATPAPERGVFHAAPPGRGAPAAGRADVDGGRQSRLGPFANRGGGRGLGTGQRAGGGRGRRQRWAALPALAERRALAL